MFPSATNNDMHFSAMLLIPGLGVIANDAAVGVEAIEALMVKATNHASEREPAYG